MPHLSSTSLKGSPISRRRALQTLFCSSAALALNINPRAASAASAAGAVNLLAVGDYGTTGKEQTAVAEAMQAYVKKQGIQTQSLLLVGDNFYTKMEGGLESARWKTGFEDMYPASAFPGPAYVVLGNHDYHDNDGGEKVQLAYAGHKPGTRWTLPAKWHRAEIGPADAPLATLLFLDSNIPEVSGGIDSKTKKEKHCLTKPEVAAQNAWLKEQLASKRAAMTLVVGHHPLYSNGSHGDTPELIEAWGGLFEKHGVQAYLCGHDHDLQHLEIKGLKTSYVLSGGGGAKVRAMKSERTVPYANPVNGFTHLEISAAALCFRHIGVDGQQLHAFTKAVDGKMTVES